MPRTSRASVGGLCYHVLNRGNGRATVFHQDGDLDAFAALLAEASEHHPMRLLGWCLLPNHFHLVLWPEEDGDLSRWMQWLMNAHVWRYHRHYHSQGQGHIWQGRFKAFPIQADEHLLAVLRYVERNPLRAGLVVRAEDWRWSSLREALGLELAEGWRRLHPGPVPRPANWRQRVNQAESAADLEVLRRSVVRGRPWARRGGWGGWPRRWGWGTRYEGADGRGSSRPAGSDRPRGHGQNRSCICARIATWLSCPTWSSRRPRKPSPCW